MIEIDGSYGSGGGQVLRTALGISAATGKEVKITSIRSNRPKPGLNAQHLAAINALVGICNAEVSGAYPGSTEVTFKPKKVSGSKLSVNIGTAGSITLLLQAILIPSMLAELKLRITGGTDVAWSPSIAYMQNVLLPALRRMGISAEVQLLSRGYYPKGNGVVSFNSSKSKLPLKPVLLTERRKPSHILLFSHSASLPKEVCLNQASAARKMLASLGGEIIEQVSSEPERNTIGSGIDLIANFEKSAMGANALGAKGKPAAEVGKEAASKLLGEIKSGAAVDSHLADQLIPFMALAGGHSEIACSLLSEHTLTNIFVTEKLLDVHFKVEGEKGQKGKVSVEGIGFSGKN